MSPVAAPWRPCLGVLDADPPLPALSLSISSMKTMPIALGCFEQLEEQALHILALVREVASPRARGTFRWEARWVFR